MKANVRMLLTISVNSSEIAYRGQRLFMPENDVRSSAKEEVEKFVKEVFGSLKKEDKRFSYFGTVDVRVGDVKVSMIRKK